MEIKIDVSTDAATRQFAVQGVLALIGAGTVIGAYTALMSVASAFASLIPFVAGSLLFATLVGSFYFLLQLLKDMRQRARFRMSFWDCYTAVAVFTVMGYMATACMHAFQSTGNPLQLWNNGVFAAVGFTVVFGCARFMGELWNDDKKKG
jgi:uncharacterized protein with PQ loop repeat